MADRSRSLMGDFPSVVNVVAVDFEFGTGLPGIFLSLVTLLESVSSFVDLPTSVPSHFDNWDLVAACSQLFPKKNSVDSCPCDSTYISFHHNSI